MAQPVTVKSIEPITQLQQGEFFHPVVGPGGQILFTGAAYTGLYMLDKQGKITTLSQQTGSGYEPLFSADGNYVYFRPYEYDGLRKLSSLVKRSLTGNEETILIENERDFTSPRKLANGNIAVSRNNELQIVDESLADINNKSPQKSVFIEKGRIALYVNGQKNILSPVGDGFYLWPSLSPDGSKLLFTKVGQGTFISTLSGDIISELGYANAPQWSPDGNWVVFMRDIDDGHRLIDSDIFISSADGTSTFPLTETSDLKEVYPSWVVPTEIVFGSDSGIIYKALLEIK